MISRTDGFSAVGGMQTMAQQSSTQHYYCDNTKVYSTGASISRKANDQRPQFPFLTPFPFLSYPFFLLRFRFFTLYLSIPPSLYSPLPNPSRGLGEHCKLPQRGRTRTHLAHLPVSIRTSWQHLSASPAFPMAQNASFPLDLDAPVTRDSAIIDVWLL